MQPTNNPPICNYEGSDYQSKFWDQGNRDYEDRAEAIALKRLLPASGNNLLELGAGAGRNTPRYKGFQRVVLLDYSRTQLLQAQQRLGSNDRYIYVAADIYHLPFVDGLFEAATMIRALHHMAKPQLALQQVRSVLRPQATFILEYANKRNIKSILRYLFRLQQWNPFDLEPVEFAELNYDFHPVQVKKWLQQSDFKICRQLTVSHFRMPFLKKLLPSGWLVWMDSIAQLTGNWWQLSPSVFTLCQSGDNSPVAAPSSFFRCPACGNEHLENSAGYLTCPQCRRKWSFQDGIYDFRLEAS
jgi:ubiquinone/menaquinone biosynthesis C-methylase UbiE